jgi:hypothetical protein
VRQEVVRDAALKETKQRQKVHEYKREQKGKSEGRYKRDGWRKVIYG